MAEDGFSMIELLVYTVLAALAMALVASIMLNAMRVQKSVQSIGTATSTASIIARSVEQGIGNASAFSVEPATAAGQLLRARTAVGAADGTATWRCRAWYYSAANSSFYTTTSTTGLVPIPASVAALGSWTLLASGVSVPSGQTAFTVGSSTTVMKLSLSVSSTATHPVVVSTTEQANPQSDTTGLPVACF